MKKSVATLAAASATSVALSLTATIPTEAAASGRTPSINASAATAPAVKWKNCSDPGLAAAGAQCGFLTVPLDYTHPHGAHIRLALSRVKHTSSAADYHGVILVNPGGPGGSGLGLSTLGQYVPNNVGSKYDWIGFDPRGVGSSQPAMRCKTGYFNYHRPDYRPTTNALLQTWLNRSKSYADACASKYPDLIKHMTTADVARDMNQIRIALGVSKISYYGFSYGTYLGQVFASIFPTRIKYMVLDSNVDVRRVWYAANLDQDRAFNRNIKIWFRWLAKYHGVYQLGDTEKKVQTRWYAILNKLAKHPAGGKVGPDEWTDTFLYAGYYRDVWLELAHDFAEYAHHGNWHGVAGFYADFNTPGDDNSFAVYTAVQCTDAPWPQQWSRWQRDNNRIYAKAPFLTWDNAWFNAPCLYWHAKARQPVKIKGGRVPSVLLIDETLDAATPFGGSLETRRLFPHASLIAEPGGATHADSLEGDHCVDNLIASYLDTGSRPKRQRWNGPDYLCRPLPDPVPAKAQAHAHSYAQSQQPTGSPNRPDVTAPERSRRTG